MGASPLCVLLAFREQGIQPSQRVVETAQTLLRHGANPNAFYTADEWPDSPLPCLYAAGLESTTIQHLRARCWRRGANPDDSESLYHSTEDADLACMRLLLEHGTSPMAVNALKHMHDREDIEGVQLLLQAGADPNQVNGRGDALHWAVWRGRSAQAVAMLLDSGAAIDAEAERYGPARRMQWPCKSGQTEPAALLEARGAKTDLSPLYSILARWPRLPGRRNGTACCLRRRNSRCLRPSVYIPDLAISHRTSAVL